MQQAARRMCSEHAGMRALRQRHARGEPSTASPHVKAVCAQARLVRLDLHLAELLALGDDARVARLLGLCGARRAARGAWSRMVRVCEALERASVGSTSLRSIAARSPETG